MGNSEEYKQRKKEIRDYRIANFLCTDCGNPLPEEERGKRKNCPECRKKRRENQRAINDIFLRRGICPKCRKYPVMGDEKSCPECRAKLTNKPITDAKRAWWRKYQNERNARNRANGICVVCRKAKADEGYVTCAKCRKKRASYEKSNKRIEWQMLGLCYLCGAECAEGRKVCEKHYQKILARSKTVEHKHNPNHPWARTTHISSTDYKKLQ